MLVGYFAILWWWLVKCALFKTIQPEFPEVLMVTAGPEFDTCPLDSFRKRLYRFKGKGAKLLGFFPSTP